MIVADTSLWIDFLDRGLLGLRDLLERGQVMMHPFIIGEFALGIPRNRARILADLGDLPKTVVAQDQEVMRFIESHKLYGLGIGFVDVHLLASVQLTPNTLLWTKDSRLRTAAMKLGLAYL